MNLLLAAVVAALPAGVSGGGEDAAPIVSDGPAIHTLIKKTCVKGDCVNGVGTRHTSGGQVYEGEWKNGLEHGQGKLTYASGDMYNGEWKMGQKHGMGSFLTAKDKKVYVRKWVHDRSTRPVGVNGKCAEGGDCLNGEGTFTWPDGATYAGTWVAGRMHGKGIYTHASGTKYDGDYVLGKKHGKGVYTFANGDEYVGGWRAGNKHGPCVETLADGTKFEGPYADGVMLVADGTVTFGAAANRGDEL